MLKIIFIRELQHYIYSLRFHIALALVILIYCIVTVSYIFEHKEQKINYDNLSKEQEEYHRVQAEKSATEFAIRNKIFGAEPRNSGFISSCKEEIIPNIIIYSAYNVFGYEISTGKNNPFLLQSENVNWSFIIIMLFSFLAIIFSFDAVSGEKESCTLALCMSNRVSGNTLLLGKFIAITTVLSVFALLGSILSIAIITAVPDIMITFNTLLELLGFIILVFLLIACISAIGLMSSVISYNSNISLLVSLSLWMVFLFVIPNSALLFSGKLFPADKEEIVAEKSRKSREEIEASYPEGKWSSRGNDLFYPRHEIRANMQMDFMLSKKKFYDDWYNQLFRQYENTRKLTWISPFALFELGTEAMLDGGYYRFKKNWHGMQNYQTQLLQFFKEFDGNDKESPHWYNPYENYSTTIKSCAFEEVPRYTERTLPMMKRISNMIVYIVLLALYTFIVFSFAIIRFKNYDVR